MVQDGKNLIPFIKLELDQTAKEKKKKVISL